MTVGPRASGIVLAGGRSARFGRDKLRAEYRGTRLVDLASAAVAEVATDVVFVVAPGSDLPTSAAATPARVRVVHDPEPFGGPLVGLLAGLEHVREPLAVVVAGDMPSLSPAVLRLLVGVLEREESRSLAALTHRGRRQPLPLALRVGAATPLVQRLVASGERSLRALLTAAPMRAIDETEWRPLDPAAETLRDIDRPEDLRRP